MILRKIGDYRIDFNFLPWEVRRFIDQHQKKLYFNKSIKLGSVDEVWNILCETLLSNDTPFGNITSQLLDSIKKDCIMSLFTSAYYSSIEPVKRADFVLNITTHLPEYSKKVYNNQKQDISNSLSKLQNNIKSYKFEMYNYDFYNYLIYPFSDFTEQDKEYIYFNASNYYFLLQNISNVPYGKQYGMNFKNLYAQYDKIFNTYKVNLDKDMNLDYASKVSQYFVLDNIYRICSFEKATNLYKNFFLKDKYLETNDYAKTQATALAYTKIYFDLCNPDLQSYYGKFGDNLESFLIKPNEHTSSNLDTYLAEMIFVNYCFIPIIKALFSSMIDNRANFDLNIYLSLLKEYINKHEDRYNLENKIQSSILNIKNLADTKYNPYSISIIEYLYKGKPLYNVLEFYNVTKAPLHPDMMVKRWQDCFQSYLNSFDDDLPMLNKYQFPFNDIYSKYISSNKRRSVNKIGKLPILNN